MLVDEECPANDAVFKSRFLFVHVDVVFVCIERAFFPLARFAVVSELVISSLRFAVVRQMPCRLVNALFASFRLNDTPQRAIARFALCR